MSRLTKAQREKLLTPEVKQMACALSDDSLLALHDFLHAIMEDRTRRRGFISESERASSQMTEAWSDPEERRNRSDAIRRGIARKKQIGAAAKEIGAVRDVEGKMSG